MEKIIVDHPKEWLFAQALKKAGKRNPIYINETVVYEFYKWSYRKARFGGIVIGMAIFVAIAAMIKLPGF